MDQKLEDSVESKVNSSTGLCVDYQTPAGKFSQLINNGIQFNLVTRS